ncbi:MAG: sulfite exporter TauE/SafE family protein [Actinobacteria bacterium]|nr:sulfite exporter TauE/SafE family protein [Actinomycetota bacterium]
MVLLIPIGVAIGIVLGSIGGGGSLVAVPVLVYIGGQNLGAAQAGALVVVIAASACGLLSYLRRDQVRWRAGLAFGVAAGISSFAGAQLSRLIDPDVLLLAFSPVMVIGALAMVRERAHSTPTFRPWRHGTDIASVTKVSTSGVCTGWLTGLFGVGGGFVIVPVLVIGLGLALTEAIGTSLLIIVIGSTVALAARLHGGEIDWTVIAPFAAAAIAGVVLGGTFSPRLSDRHLTRWFAGLVVLTALYTACKAAGGLL